MQKLLSGDLATLEPLNAQTLLLLLYKISIPDIQGTNELYRVIRSIPEYKEKISIPFRKRNNI